MNAPSEEENDDSKTSFMRNKKRFSIILPSSICKFCKEIAMQNSGQMMFSNRQFGMRVYNRTVIIVLLE
jgi:hypothetical protein